MEIADDFTFSDAATHFASANPFSLYPNHDPMVINIPAEITEAQQVAIRNAELLICVRLLVRFSNAFTNDRFADFGYWIMFEGLRNLRKYSDSN